MRSIQDILPEVLAEAGVQARVCREEGGSMTDIDRLIAEVEANDARILSLKYSINERSTARYRLAAAAPTLAAELKALREAVRALLAPANVYEATKAHIAEHWSELLDTDAMVKNALGRDSRLTVEKFAADAVGGVVFAKLAALVGWKEAR